MFYDLNIPRPKTRQEEKLFRDILEVLHKFNYRCIAVTTTVSNETLLSELSKNTFPADPLPLPYKLENSLGIIIINRLNVEVSDANNFLRLQRLRNIKAYDLISIEPENQNVFKALSSWNEFDILAFNPFNKFMFNLNRKLYNNLISNGIYLELNYSPMLNNPQCRKQLIRVAHLYHAVGRSRNIIITSRAPTSNLIRNPYDVINLNLLFGLSEEQAKYAISKTCEKLLLKARTKRRGKSVIEIMSKLENNYPVSNERKMY